jgi:pSer/pThr/pTyr-binding forkhead associated (FHA) protein
MKVQLIVVQGKPEGKMIPLQGPKFKIGRGENCNLRPNSEQVSREHAEFAIGPDKVVVKDLGSRNGTLVNGKALTEPYALKDRDLIQIGPLTFAISIQGVPVAAPKEAKPVKSKPASPDDVSHSDIESWLVSDAASAPPDRPSGIYGGDTQTISTFEGAKPGGATTGSGTKDDSDEPVDEEAETRDDVETLTDEEQPEELIDESNPFQAAKKAPPPSKAPAKDSSDAAGDILRRLMERRRGS